MVNRYCKCCYHLAGRSDAAANFYNSHFIPERWESFYSKLSECWGVNLVGKCKACGGDLEETIPLPKGLTGDDLLKAIYDTRLERDDVYQQLAIRLIRCVEKHDAQKGSLEKYIYTSLKYELLSCVKPRPLTGITGAPKDFRRGNVVSIDAIREDSGLFQDYMAA